jgi:ADP-heptose:LPS heptosyltransferase
MVVKKSIPADKVILVHKGGLGDFLQAWPTILAIRKGAPDSELLWVGKDEYRCWLEALRIDPCPPEMHKAVDALYWIDAFPQALYGATIVWFGLERSVLTVQDERIVFLRGIDPQRETPPWSEYAYGAQSLLGIQAVVAFEEEFVRLFAGTSGEVDNGEILLFPGSGHPMKCWPAVQYFQLGRWLQGQGLAVRIVLGPAEVDRGLNGESFPTARPGTLAELQRLLSDARLVVGNDCGPMHLAGMLGIPGLVLFGPTSPERWCPHGLEAIRGLCPESPCSETARIACTDNLCMKSIDQDLVRSRLALLLQKEDGLLRTVRNKPSSAKIGR